MPIFGSHFCTTLQTLFQGILEAKVFHNKFYFQGCKHENI